MGSSIAFGSSGTATGCDSNGTFVLGGTPAGSATNYISTSTDGVTFTPSTTTVFSVAVNAIHYSPRLGLWLAGASAGTNTIGTSTDGFNFVGFGNSTFSSKCLAIQALYTVSQTPTRDLFLDERDVKKKKSLFRQYLDSFNKFFY